MASADWSNRGGTPFRYDKTIAANDAATHPDYPAVFAIWGKDKRDEATRLADLVEFLKKNAIVADYSQVALLLHSVRQEHSGHYLAALEARGIPAFCPRARAYFENDVIRDLVGCFAVLFGWHGDGRGQVAGAVAELASYVDGAIVELGRRFGGPHPLAAALRQWTEEIVSLTGGEALDLRPADYLYRLLAFEPFRSAVEDENAARNLAPALDAGAGEVAQGPGGAERRGPPRPRRGPCLEPVAARHSSSAAAGAFALARLLGHTQRPERHVLPLDGVRLPARPGGGGPHRQGAADRHQGGRSQAAQGRSRRRERREYRREVRLLAAGRGAALEGAPRGLQAARHPAEFATTETEVHQADIAAGELAPGHELLASITNKVIDRARLPNRFAELYPAVRDYVATRCFGRAVDLDAEALRSHLARLDLQEGIAKYLARKIAELTVERRAIEFDKADFRLSETRPSRKTANRRS